MATAAALAKPKTRRIIYNAEPTIALFHASNAFYRGLMGNVRSGKSTGCSMEIMRRIREQQPGPDGYRRSRFAIVRNTYRELEDTTLKTWMMWFDSDYFGGFNQRSMTHYVEFEDVRAEVIFRALDRPKDIAKLLSMELTGAWINEAREVPKPIVDTLGDRVGQYPPKSAGGCTWRGVIMDTNPPDTDHWWFETFEEDRPHGWEFFRQPGALIERDGEFIPNPLAENIGNLTEGINYYLTRVPGKKKEYIRVYYCGQYGFVQDGKPVHPEYVDSTHCSNSILVPTPGLTITIGLDFGLTPAAAFVQQQVNGQWICFDELTTDRLGVKRFGQYLLGPKINEYSDFPIVIWGDPAGSDESQTREETCFQILDAIDIPAMPAPVHDNDATIRREALAGPISRLIDGKPGFLLSPACKTIRKGLAGGFYYRRLQVPGDVRYQDKPFKNKYSHPVEALEYALVGSGEGKIILHKPPKTETHIPRVIGMKQGWMR